MVAVQRRLLMNRLRREGDDDYACEPRVSKVSPLPAGIEVVTRDDHTLVLISELSDDLKAHIEGHFAAWCFGAVQVDARPSSYSFKKMAREFLDRFESKAPTTQIGMIGELLVHVVADHCLGDLRSFGLYFNKEEKSIKKGFDLTFFDGSSDQVWYAEVKSGEPADATDLASKARQLVQTGANDLAHKLTDQASRSRWDSALIDVALTLYGPHQVTVRNLLHDDIDDVAAGLVQDWAGFVAGVVIYPQQTASLDADELFEALDTLTTPGAFAQYRTLVIQKSTINKVVSYFREVADA